jgi:hypothetical protein
MEVWWYGYKYTEIPSDHCFLHGRKDIQSARWRWNEAGKISQIKPYRDPDRYIYTELVFKTNSGTFKKLHVSIKVVPIFVSAEAGEHCPVQILDLYYSKLPPAACESDVSLSVPLKTFLLFL